MNKEDNHINKITEKIALISNKKLFKILYSYANGFKKSIILITILNSVNALITVGMALVVKNIIDAATNQDLEKVKFLGVIVIITLIVKLILSKSTSVYTTYTNQLMNNNLQYKVIESYYNNKWLFIDSYKTGDLITRATNDVSQVISILIGTFPSFVSLVIQLGTAFYILSSYDWIIAFVAFILGPLTIVLSLLVGHKLKALQRQVQDSVSDLRSSITESVQNIELIKTYNIDANRLNELNKFQKLKRQLVTKKAIYKAFATGFIDLGYTFGYLGAILIGAYKLYNKDISFGTFTAFSQLVTHIQSPMYGITKTIPSIMSVLSSVERISELNTNQMHKEKKTLCKPIHSITFNDVSFSYENRSKVLDHLNFNIIEGQNIGLKGASGEGKTTILRLLLSLIEPTDGSIKIKYKDNTEEILNDEVINVFSYVPQRNSLFSGSILSNLQLGNPKATENDIILALSTSEIYSFVKNLPEGLDTIVGERLAGLSEGQAQRICIARALLHETPFLILDEATSALDISTEKKIVEGIKNNYKNKTLIAVTHRAQIFDICDVVYEYDDFQLIKR